MTMYYVMQCFTQREMVLKNLKYKKTNFIYHAVKCIILCYLI